MCIMCKRSQNKKCFVLFFEGMKEFLSRTFCLANSCFCAVFQSFTGIIVNPRQKQTSMIPSEVQICFGVFGKRAVFYHRTWTSARLPSRLLTYPPVFSKNLRWSFSPTQPLRLPNLDLADQPNATCRKNWDACIKIFALRSGTPYFFPLWYGSDLFCSLLSVPFS